MTILGDKLAAARAARGWSLREAEKRTSIPNAHLSQIETGTIQHPELGTLLPLAAAYGIPVDDLAALAGHDVAALKELSGNGVRVSLITAADPGRYSFTRAELVGALRRRKQPDPYSKTVTVLEGDAALEHLADSIIEALTERAST